MSERAYRDKGWLRQKYIGEKKSTTEIGELCGVTKQCIREWLHKHDIPTRDASEATKLEWEGAEERKEEIGEIFSEANQTIHPHFFMDSEGYNICGAADGDGGSWQVRMNRLLATLKVDHISELDGIHVHHDNDIPWLDYEDNLELLTPSEHAKLTRNRDSRTA